MYELLFLLVWIIFFAGVYRKDLNIIFIDGFLFVLLGLEVLNSPFRDLSIALNYTLGWTHVALGLYFLLRGALKLITEDDEILDRKIREWVKKLKNKLAKRKKR